MEGIKEKLSEKYLKMEDYFNISYDILKKLIFKNKFIITGIFVLSLILNIIQTKMAEEYLRLAKERNLEEFIQVIVRNTESTFSSMINILLGVLFIIIMKKVASEIENKNDFSLFDILKRYLMIVIFEIVLFGFFSFSFLLIMFIGAGIARSMLMSGTGSDINAIHTIIIFTCISVLYVGAVSFIYWIKFLYFKQLFILRDLKFRESIFYNFHLCKGNRLRIIIPHLLLFILGYFLFLPFTIMSFVLGSPFSNIFTIMLFAVGVIFNVLVSIMYIILSTVIYMNVEYMDLKKSKTEKNTVENKLFENNEEN